LEQKRRGVAKHERRKKKAQPFFPFISFGNGLLCKGKEQKGKGWAESRKEASLSVFVPCSPLMLCNSSPKQKAGKH